MYYNEYNKEYDVVYKHSIKKVNTSKPKIDLFKLIVEKSKEVFKKLFSQEKGRIIIDKQNVKTTNDNILPPQYEKISYTFTRRKKHKFFRRVFYFNVHCLCILNHKPINFVLSEDDEQYFAVCKQILSASNEKEKNIAMSLVEAYEKKSGKIFIYPYKSEWFKYNIFRSLNSVTEEFYEDLYYVIIKPLFYITLSAVIFKIVLTTILSLI